MQRPGSIRLPEPTVQPAGDFDAQADATALRAAMKGCGTDEDELIAILTKRTESQRCLIAQAFKEEFGRDLIEDIKSEMSGHCEDVLVALVEGVAKFLARQVHDAISGAGTDEQILIDILCPRTNNEIADIADAYLELFETSLEDDLAGDTSGHFRRLLIVLVNEARREWDPVDESKAKADAEALYNAGEGMSGTDEDTFNAILAHQSPRQLRLVFREYSELAGRTIEESINSELSGTIQTALLTMVEAAQNRASFFAKRLNEAMDGSGTTDEMLLRIIVSRAEIDLGTIKQEYENIYDRSLEGQVAGEVSSTFKSVLLALLG